jgi:hypothetical protein
MGEIDEKITEAIEKASESRLNSVIAVLVAVTATLMALNNVKDGNIVQAMQQAQAKSVDEWAHYQAEGTKANLATASREQVELMRDTTPGATPETKALFQKRIDEYNTQEKKYEAKKEDSRLQAKGFEEKYNELNTHDDQFDMAEALMSVAIALLGVTILFSATGMILGFAGFFGWNLHPDWLANILS